MKVAVIGSGPGGAVVASKLLEAGYNIDLYEKGDLYEQHELEPFSKDELLKKYNGAGISVALGNPKIKFVEGSCWGGGSEVNAGLYHEINEVMISSWAKEYLIENFSKESLAKHFQQTRDAVNVEYSQQPLSQTSLKLKEGADKLGWKVIEVPRWFKNGVRQSMTETYLTSEIRSKIIKEKVISIKKREHSWVVSSSQTTRAYDAVFLCAGAIETPSLLQKSKLSKNAGKKIFMHPSLKIVAEYPEEINSLSPAIGIHQVKEFSPDISMGCSISTPEYISLALNENGTFHNEMSQSRFKTMAIYYVMINAGKGSITNIPFIDNPIVKYKMTNCELDKLQHGTMKLCHLLFESGAKSLYPAISKIGKLSNPDEIVTLKSRFKRKNLNLMTIHLMGSCPFGEDISKTVANSYGEVHFHKNLFIADSSLMCSGLGVNPQGTVMALASRVAEHFIKRNSKD